jgi:hypothetical protein
MSREDGIGRALGWLGGLPSKNLQRELVRKWERQPHNILKNEHIYYFGKMLYIHRVNNFDTIRQFDTNMT